MLINVVIYTFAPDKADEAATLFGALRTASRAETGCRSFEVSRAIDDRCVFVLHEVWDDRAALDAHYETAHFKRLGASGIRVLATSRTGYLCSPIAD